MSINIAIGFVTGRKHFQSILTTYVNNWLEHGLISDKKIRLHLLVAYDLKYAKTEISDYKNIDPKVAELIDSISFYGKPNVEQEKQHLIDQEILTEKEADLLFGDGYAKKRNVVLYFAIKRKMDRLIFIDDDEYPLAVTKTPQGHLSWRGQSMVGTHLKYSPDSDITHGHHCGYISPIPYIHFNENLNENDFRTFIKAISNEIVSWETVRENILLNKGLTFANATIMNRNLVKEVPEVTGMKFISGANLCFNLASCATKVPPFYNPPGARGEDTFMSTGLKDLKVTKVPVYTFHDGFLQYQPILKGSLPVYLQEIDPTSPDVVHRFVNATLGWIRYKPLMLYSTQRENYEQKINKMMKDLEKVVPKFCEYFHHDGFQKLLPELEFYHKNVKKHFQSFQRTKEAWKKLISATTTNN